MSKPKTIIKTSLKDKITEYSIRKFCNIFIDFCFLTFSVETRQTNGRCDNVMRI